MSSVPFGTCDVIPSHLKDLVHLAFSIIANTARLLYISQHFNHKPLISMDQILPSIHPDRLANFSILYQLDLARLNVGPILLEPNQAYLTLLRLAHESRWRYSWPQLWRLPSFSVLILIPRHRLLQLRQYSPARKPVSPYGPVVSPLHLKQTWVSMVTLITPSATVKAPSCPQQQG
jgi:hypothetical protein